MTTSSNGEKAEEAAAVDETTKQKWTFEDVLRSVKPLGRWQLNVYFWIGLVTLLRSPINLGVLFYQITPVFNCDVPSRFPTGNEWTVQQKLNIRSNQMRRTRMSTAAA